MFELPIGTGLVGDALGDAYERATDRLGCPIPTLLLGISRGVWVLFLVGEPFCSFRPETASTMHNDIMQGLSVQMVQGSLDYSLAKSCPHNEYLNEAIRGKHVGT